MARNNKRTDGNIKGNTRFLEPTIPSFGVHRGLRLPQVCLLCHGLRTQVRQLLRGTIVNRTYGTHKNLYNSLFLLTKFGPIYYGPP